MSLFDASDFWPPVRKFRGWLGEDHIVLMQRCVEAMSWEQRKIHGIPMPRHEALVGPPGFRYKYSGNTYVADKMQGTFIEDISNRIRGQTGHIFDICFANYYRTGRDSIGWHSDDEPSLGPAHEVVVVSLSLGRSALFEMRRRGSKKYERILLEGGDLLLMNAGSQSEWEHRVPKGKSTQPRVCLTFRRAINAKANRK